MADPFQDEAEPGVTVAAFYDVDLKDIPLPMLMLVSGSERKVTLLDGVRDQDELAGLIQDEIFKDYVSRTGGKKVKHEVWSDELWVNRKVI